MAQSSPYSDIFEEPLQTGLYFIYHETISVILKNVKVTKKGSYSDRVSQPERCSTRKVFFLKGCFPEAVNIYCEAITCLISDLNLADLKSRGFLAFREYRAERQTDGFNR